MGDEAQARKFVPSVKQSSIIPFVRQFLSGRITRHFAKLVKMLTIGFEELGTGQVTIMVACSRIVWQEY